MLKSWLRPSLLLPSKRYRRVADQDKTATESYVQQEDLTRKNKALVFNAYQELFGDHDPGALDRYWAENSIQQNPTMTDGRASVKILLG